jgi:nitrous oxidase accessory protein NosD
MIKKGIAIWFVVILVVLSLVFCSIISKSEELFSSLQSNNFGGTIWYVGGTGPNNYTKIQDAINNASDGDTVFVYSGLYNDYYSDGQFSYTVLVSKTIRLIGEDKYNTIINGTGSAIVVKIAAESVEISGFTIQHGGSNFCGGIRIMDYYGKTNIHDNIIINNNAGIYAFLNWGLTIQNNIIDNNEIGIFFYDEKICLIKYNIISNNSIGISVVFGETNSVIPVNIISDNEIRDNKLGIETTCSELNIRFNNFINNDEQTEISKGVYLHSIYLIFTLKNVWYKNYWDDLELILPKPIKGFAGIAIQLPRKDITIAVLPYFEIDRYPQQTPYNIRGKMG